MMSSMHKKALTLALFAASVAGVAATITPTIKLAPIAMQSASQVPAPRPAPVYQAPRPAAYPAIAPHISQAVAQWNSLRQSDSLSFSSYSWFLTHYRGWPGETAMRKTAERAIDPVSTPPSQVVAYFRLQPALTATGDARHAFALQAMGQAAAAREAARKAWHGGVLQRADEDRLLATFGSTLTPYDHDQRMETLLANGDVQSAQRTLPYVSAHRRAAYDARLAMQTEAPDAAARLAALGSAAGSDAGVLMDQANWLRATHRSAEARRLLAAPRRLAIRPKDAEKWYETLLTMARGAENDRNWLIAYQIASQVDDAYPAGVRVIDQSVGERDDYTSLTWLAGTIALDRLNRPSDAATMFAKYARGGKSSQVLSKGLYWAGRAAQRAGQNSVANVYFTEAAAYPELFYGQLALERLGQPVPVPAVAIGTPPTPAERAAFNRRELVQATRLLGQMGAWNDQSLFIRTLSERVETEKDRMLATELARQISRPDLGVWVARNARNDGRPFYVRDGYPMVGIPPAQSHYWSLAHGIIRQESSFDRGAVSHAGALGMMQLMRPTAQEQAGKMGIGYDGSRLTRDPNYNIMLGSAYFARLMDQWGGYAPLAIASYNAGAGNVRRWVNENGDPRTPGVDIVTWIERIPYSETRGYVQRVLENAVVYDALNPSRTRAPARTRLSYYLGKANRPG
jgi:soluble lytic murein transglycosylase